MITLQKKIGYQGDVSQSPISKFRLVALFPVFDYIRSNTFNKDVDVTRTTISTDYIEIDHELSSETYTILVPTSDLVGKKDETITDFWNFTTKAITAKTIDDISFTFPIKIIADSAVIGICTFHAFYIIKYIRHDEGIIYFRGGTEPSEMLSFVEKNIFLINKDTYQKVLPDFNKITNRNDSWLLLSVIWQFVMTADIEPMLPLELNETLRTLLDNVFEQENIENRAEAIKFIEKFFNDCFDFPILIPEIKTIVVSGTFEVKMPEDKPITKNDLLFYNLSLEYSIQGAGDLTTPNIVHYDWNSNNNPIDENKIQFSFFESSPLILNSISGKIILSVKSFDGSALWIKDFEPNDPMLQEVMISVTQLRPVTLNSAQTTGSIQNTRKKLRGQVLELTKKCSLKDLTVVIQAKKEGDEFWRVVAAASTDASANFSLPYPYGEYIKAQAIVSLTPDSPADIPIKNIGIKNETIADDFLYLLLTNPNCPECPDSSNEKDPNCDGAKKAKRLPDQSDLIDSDEYTQDIGGSCVNLSTPNRTLSERNYRGIIRTSDPDVANYTLKKIKPFPYWYVAQPKILFEEVSPIQSRFELVRGAETIKRSPVDFNNPIKWQDAPDNKDDLSLYQAVTVATGHILHYKTVTKADGYSLGNLLYSLALAPGQKKQIVMIESTHSLQGFETQNIIQGEELEASLHYGRDINDLLSGNINEALSGRSSASTSGVSAGLGVAANLGVVSGALGVAGGYASSQGSASQNSSRDAAMFFGEQLRQSVMQSAESYRELNATVITSVKEKQNYAATTDVVANHNHCHSLTMMYFEVLRHYAVYQELSHVEECVFVPLLMTNFTVENIYKWKDVLASHLLAISSNTYLQQFSWKRQHPLLKGFDANERIKTKYAHVDFPTGRYCDETINTIDGKITIRANIPRPKTKFDRILSLPVIKKTVTTQGGVDVRGTIEDNIKDSALGAITGGISLLFGGGPSVKYTTTSHEVLTRGQIFDMFMTLDGNYETVPPAQCIRVSYFRPQEIEVNNKKTTIDIFEENSNDRKLWSAYAFILDMDIYELLNKFSGNVISDWDTVFYDDIAPQIISALINEKRIVIKPLGNLDFTSTNKYSGREQLLKYNIRATTTLARSAKELEQIDINYNFRAITIVNFKTLDNFLEYPEIQKTIQNRVTLTVESLTINYSTNHYNGKIYSGYVGNDLFDNVLIPTPLNSDEKRNPRLEDIYIVTQLIEHLNSNLEYYNKILWYRLDPDRRFMLLDGFDIQILNDFGVPVGSRSLASVVKNQLITVVGNSLVFPVAAGYKVGQSYILEDNGDLDTEKITLLDHYKPLTPVPPYRISVPTKGVFAEAVMGACDACEREKEKSSQDWTKFTTEEPTPIAPIITPTPTITDWKAAWKDFAPPLINIQNAPATPEPGAGLTGITELLGKSGVFKDITGLDATQQNVIRTYLSNQENARAFAEMAKNMQMQNHNTDHSDKIMDSLNTAKASGAINHEDYGKLVKDHLQRQIDGGETENQQYALQSKKQETSPIKSAVELAQTGNKDVSATESDGDGNTKTLNVKSIGDSNTKGGANNKTDNTNLKYNFTVPGTIEAIQQQSANACWATVTTMMSNWKKQQTQSVDDYINSIGAEYIPFIQTGIPITKLTDFCKAAGLETAYSNTNFPISVYYEKLQKNGPIWVIDLESDNPKLLHGRLLIGIKGDDNAPTTLFTIIDPATGSQYDEALPTFISKMENVVKTLDAVKDVQIPLLIYYKDAYEKSKYTGKSNGGVSIGTGSASAFSIIQSPSISGAIANFKSIFSSNPKILTFGQFQITNLVYEEIIKAVNADLTAKPNAELQAVWNDMLSASNGILTSALINKINERGISSDYPRIVKVYGPDVTATKAWAQDLYKKFWLRDNAINPSPNVTPATIARFNAAYNLGGIDLNGQPTGEKGACHNSTHALGRKYVNAKGLAPIPANLKISRGQIAGAKSKSEGMLDRVVYSSPGALNAEVDKIKLALDAGYPVVCGLLSGVKHDMTALLTKKKLPNPEHYVLVFGYENNVFAFWDSDVSVSDMTATDWGPGFGLLVATTTSFSTGWDEADLRAVDGEGNHLNFPKRHRYQVYSVQTLPI